MEQDNEVKQNTYQIDFDGNVLCAIKITDKGIEVVGAMNGYGDGIPSDKINVTILPPLDKNE